MKSIKITDNTYKKIKLMKLIIGKDHLYEIIELSIDNYLDIALDKNDTRLLFDLLNSSYVIKE